MRVRRRSKRQAKALTGWPWVKAALTVFLWGNELEVGALAGLLKNRLVWAALLVAEVDRGRPDYP